MVQWIQGNESILWWLAASSAFTFVASLVAVPWLVVRIPRDYFVPGATQRVPWADRHPVVRVTFAIGKNVLGCVFVVAGIIMLVLPGQGLLTILLGIVLLDFPGKQSVLRGLVRQPAVLDSINWLRRRSGRAPLIVERSYRCDDGADAVQVAAGAKTLSPRPQACGASAARQATPLRARRAPAPAAPPHSSSPSPQPRPARRRKTRRCP